MTIIGLLVALALIGLVAYLLVTFVPMTNGMKQLIGIAAVLIGVLILLSAFGLMNTGVLNQGVPRLR